MFFWHKVLLAIVKLNITESLLCLFSGQKISKFLFFKFLITHITSTFLINTWCCFFLVIKTHSKLATSFCICFKYIQNVILTHKIPYVKNISSIHNFKPVTWRLHNDIIINFKIINYFAYHITINLFFYVPWDSSFCYNNHSLTFLYYL